MAYILAAVLVGAALVYLALGLALSYKNRKSSYRKNDER